MIGGWTPAIEPHGHIANPGKMSLPTLRILVEEPNFVVLDRLATTRLKAPAEDVLARATCRAFFRETHSATFRLVAGAREQGPRLLVGGSQVIRPSGYGPDEFGLVARQKRMTGV